MVDFLGTLLPLIIFLVVPLSAGIVLALPNTVDSVLTFLIFYTPLALAYGTNPYKSTKKWDQEFVQQGHESIIHEFQSIKIIFFILILFSIIDIFLAFSGYISQSRGLRDNADNFPFIVFSIYLVLFAIGTGLRILTRVMHKDFRFYLAKGYCIAAINKEDEFEMLGCLFLVLDAYNKYLRRRAQIQIKDTNRVYTTFLVADLEEKNKIAQSMCKLLEGDRLGLARYLVSIYKVQEMEFFVRESIVQKLKVVGTTVAAPIPIVISIIGLLTKFDWITHLL